jgi:predicted nucleotidyltransferase
MSTSITFPTRLHQDTAEIAREYFLNISEVDTILITNSCARGQAIPESDLDMVILVRPQTDSNKVSEIETAWIEYSKGQSTINNYKHSSPYAHLHLDVISGKYTPALIEPGGQVDSFEIEIGNHICHSASFGGEGKYFQQLKLQWLPYYSNKLRIERFRMVQNVCRYDLEHIPFLVKRGLHFHAFDILYTAFQKFLQLLFISKRTYPIAYNKWVKHQIVNWLKMPELYLNLLPVISINKIESDEINQKALALGQLLNSIEPI